VGAQNQGKLNWLQHNLPDGLVVDAAWLEHQGYSSGLRSKYVKHGWIEQLARGVYRRPPAKMPEPIEDDGLRWQHVVISLQTLLKHPFTVGGRTALEVEGFAHYLTAAGPREVHLYGNDAPPRWVFNLRLENQFVFHTSRKLFKDQFALEPLTAPGTALSVDQSPNAGPLPVGLIRQQWGSWGWPLILSSPERAVLELLDEIPKRETFHQVDMLMEGLRNLSPRQLHKLLTECHSVKVKRLFLWFAERHNHAWLKKLDQDGIDLGHGKRMIVRGGKLDTKYNITVPEPFNAVG
jgi:hypothetical protein